MRRNRAPNGIDRGVTARLARSARGYSGFIYEPPTVHDVYEEPRGCEHANAILADARVRELSQTLRCVPGCGFFRVKKRD